MSWPAACAYGPSWPQPVMRPYTSFELRARPLAGPVPQPLRHAGPEALDERVRLLDHAQHGLDAVGLLEVDADRPPAAVQHLHPPGVESALDRLRAVDAHHVGAHVGEQHRGERPRPDARDLNDLYVRQTSHAATLATVPCMGETIASGYGLAEGPTVDGGGNS